MHPASCLGSANGLGLAVVLSSNIPNPGRAAILTPNEEERAAPGCLGGSFTGSSFNTGGIEKDKSASFGVDGVEEIQLAFCSNTLILFEPT